MGEWRITGEYDPEPMCHGCDELEQEIDRLREALEKIERGGPWDSQSIARAALHTEGGGDG